MPIGEKTWAPVGYLLASLFKQFQATDQTWASLYQGLWLIHMVSTMVFVASISVTTKFFHIIGIPLSSLLTPKKKRPF